MVRANPRFIQNWYGDASFTFYVRDALGLVSEKQLVVIHVTPVSDPPTTEDVTLVVNEDTCFSSESACAKYVPYTVAPFVTITAADPEDDPFTMQAPLIPSPLILILLRRRALTLKPLHSPHRRHFTN